jgi:hypothetical protein
LAGIQDAEFKVFSQFGEDGIIQYLVQRTEIPWDLRTFIEFGVESYEEANTRFLLTNNNWRGLIIDSDAANINKVRSSELAWRHELESVCAFVSAENVDGLISDAGFVGEIGLLSIDIDGNDYWVWKAISVVSPVIVVIEYNSVFGSDRAVTVPYDSAFVRRDAHYTNLYWGCSLRALALLGELKGYALVGSNSAGNNAFFVRCDHLNRLKAQAVREAYVESRFRESRDCDGHLTFLAGQARLQAIADLPLYDVENDVMIRAADMLPSSRR